MLGYKDINIGQAVIEEVNSQIISSILAAAKVAIPTSSSGTPHPNSNPWWNKDCESEDCESERKEWGTAFIAETRMRRRTRKWKQPTETATELLLRPRRTTGCLLQIPFRPTDGTWVQCGGRSKRWKGKSLHQSTTYGRVTASTARTRPRRTRFPKPSDMRQRRREMEADYSDPEPDDSLTVNSPLTLAELKRARSAIKKVKVSTGVDTVSYHMLKEVPESFLKSVLGFFQRCWEGGAVPSGWKHAVFVPTHKHGKPRKELGSYRPISLTSHLGKVFERVVKHRLENFCESKKVFPACQAGFRRGRGVTDHLVKLGEHIGRA